MQYCKRLLGVKSTTQNDFVYGELGRLSFQYIRYFNIIKYWVKILHLNDNKYVRKVYDLLKDDIVSMPNKHIWCTLLKHLLCNLGFYDAWLFQTVGDSKLFLNIVKTRLKDQFVQNWSGRLSESNRAVCYRAIAHFQFQTYSDTLDIRKFRVSLTKLRVSSHRLHVEIG